MSGVKDSPTSTVTPPAQADTTTPPGKTRNEFCGCWEHATHPDLCAFACGNTGCRMYWKFETNPIKRLWYRIQGPG
jgi:hypothetical protein